MAAPQEYVSDREPDPAGKAHILFVDDEIALRQLVRESLESKGFRVTTSSHAKAAIELYRQNHGDIDLVILDMLMPGMSGLDALAAMKMSNPNVRAVLSSAYVPGQDCGDVQMHGFVDFLPKPFKTRELVALVTRLAEPPAEASGES